MRSLQQFQSQPTGPLFPDADPDSLPTFFHQNLVNPSRVVKQFRNDVQANIRIFYYQYLKLCFELESVDYEGYINKVEQIINNQNFKFMFYGDDDPALFNDMQFKSFIMQFFGVLGEGSTTVQDALNKYSIVDTVLIYFFRALLILTGKTDSLDSYVEREELLHFLCEYFGVEISIHDRCIKFEETDIFVYEEDPKEVFMAYMMEEQQEGGQRGQILQEENQQGAVDALKYLQEEPQQNNYQPFALDSIPQPPQQVMSTFEPSSNSSRRNNNTEINTSYISTDFVDYTSNSLKNNLTSLVGQSNLKESGSIDGSAKTINQNILNESINDASFKKTETIPNIATNTFQNKPSSYKTDEIATYNNNNYSYNASNVQKYIVPDPIITPSYTTSAAESYLSKNSYTIDTPLYKKQEETNKISSQYEWQPTKDPGFMEKYNPSQFTTSLNSYQKPSSSSKQYQSYQPVQTYKIDTVKPNSYQSNASSTSKYSEPKKPTSSEAYQPYSMPAPSYQNQYKAAPPSSGSGSFKNPFGLNVSLEFTNSFTMKAMAEPFKSNVKTIRGRARDFRNSLKGFIK